MSSKQISIFLTPIVGAVSLSPNARDDSIEPVHCPGVTLSHTRTIFSELRAIFQHLVECTGSQMLYAMEPINSVKIKGLLENKDSAIVTIKSDVFLRLISIHTHTI